MLQLTYGRLYKLDTVFHITNIKNNTIIMDNGILPFRMEWWKPSRQAVVHAIVSEKDVCRSFSMVSDYYKKSDFLVFNINAVEYPWTGDPTMTGKGELNKPCFVVTNKIISPYDIEEVTKNFWG